MSQAHARRAPRACTRCSSIYTPRSNRQAFCGTCNVCEGGCGRRTRRPDVRFCSSTCSNRRRSLPPLACGWCAEQVPPNRSRKATYCSEDCRVAAFRARRSAQIGATHLTAGGYVEERTADGWELQHRVVMARALSRALGSDEHVHHKNGQKDDNALANLELCVVGSSAHPPGQRVGDLVRWAQEILNRYGEHMEIVT